MSANTNFVDIKQFYRFCLFTKYKICRRKNVFKPRIFF